MQHSSFLARMIDRLTGCQENTGIRYWQRRAKQFGPLSVLNLGHRADDIAVVTAQQKAAILPFFRQALNGREAVLLDFGCGPGRFTSDLASIIDGKAIGVDPISDYLKWAPKAPNVDYCLMKVGRIPLPSDSVDIVWVCLVLGGLNDSLLKETSSEILRVLRRDGLLFLVENTSEHPSVPHWTCRQFNEYQDQFHDTTLVHLTDYFDLGERISIMAGRKS